MTHDNGAGDSGELAVLLAGAYRAMTDRLHERLNELGHNPKLRPAHGFAFQYLSWHPEATAVELGAHLGITKQAAGQLTDELERLGYVARIQHPRDRRARIIRLTEQGWACIRDVAAYWAEAEAHWAGLIGGDALNTVRTALRAYVADTGDPRTGVKPTW